MAAGLLAALVVTAGGTTASPATAGERLVIRGAGFGHGVGMSQWGARGMALRGADARQILAHYYRGTRLSRLSSPRRVRVALQWGAREATLSGVATIGGRRVRPDRSYRLTRDGDGIAVRPVDGGRSVGRAPAGVRAVPAAGTIRVAGRAADGVQDGSFRGRIDVLPDGDGVLVVNDIDLEDYLRGVVTEESPASWPAAALEAQAVAARTYALTSAVGGRPFDQWPDTRSQVYTGVTGETAAGDRAIAATRGRVVTLRRRPVTTYFFSTSGGRTEDARNVFPDPKRRSWLRSVPDPHEPDAEMRRWTRTFSPADADRRTARFGVGPLRRIDVLRRGESPRVVRARVVGERGTRTVSGEALQLAFDLPDRWASFATVSISRCLRGTTSAGPAAGAARERAQAAAADPVVGEDPASVAMALAERHVRDAAALLSGASAPRPVRGCRLVGAVRPAPKAGTARLERRDDGRWRATRRVVLDGAGRFDVVVPRDGVWRVRAGGFATDAVRAR